jgi:hypothetical protein
MTTVTSLDRRRAVVAAILAIAGAALIFFSAGSEPAQALCKYGGPNCVNPNPGPKYPTVNNNKLPDSTWVDPDCKYYGNCQSPNSARRAPGTKAVPGTKLVQRQ